MRQLWRLSSFIKVPLYNCSRMTVQTSKLHISNTLCKRYNHSDTTNEKHDWELEVDQEYQQIQQEYIGGIGNEHRIFVIQPFIKWGRNKRRNTKPELQLAEAISLVETLPDWMVVEKKCISLLTLKKMHVFGTGNLENLKHIARQCNATAIFISTDLLKFGQVMQLQEEFNLPVYDRYSVVINIFHVHATSPEAKLQVAIAELPYIRKKMNTLAVRADGHLNLDRRKKEALDRRAKTLQEALEKLEKQRKQIKTRRMSFEIPSVAVVGYTNAGKTSLIKALSGDASLQPVNKLFATLDTTVHKGILPCELEVLYIDTIGFIQDVPEMLIKPFLVTLEDAITADVIVHVFDISHPDIQAQVDHVHKTLENLLEEKKSIIHVANKCDLTIDPTSKSHIPEGTLIVSAKKSIGTDLLRMRIEEEVLIVTKRKRTRVRVKLGSPEETWLYKRTTVVNIEQDPKSTEHSIMEVIVTDGMLREFFAFLRSQN